MISCIENKYIYNSGFTQYFKLQPFDTWKIEYILNLLLDDFVIM